MSAQAPRPKHDCPGGCGAHVPFHLLACKSCWFELPSALRDAVNGTYYHRASSPEPYRRAIRAALVWYRDQAALNTTPRDAA